jgi:predicted alpha/beta-hydrolase family hydrolase
VILGGHSYGGRQASMLAAEEPLLASALLLLSYPLHPPRKPTDLRTEHFPGIRIPCLFVHGTKDPFGSPEEMTGAIRAIQAPVDIMLIEGAGHELKPVIAESRSVSKRLLGQLSSVGAST